MKATLEKMAMTHTWKYCLSVVFSRRESMVVIVGAKCEVLSRLNVRIDSEFYL